MLENIYQVLIVRISRCHVTVMSWVQVLETASCVKTW